MLFIFGIDPDRTHLLFRRKEWKCDDNDKTKICTTKYEEFFLDDFGMHMICKAFNTIDVIRSMILINQFKNVIKKEMKVTVFVNIDID